MAATVVIVLAVVIGVLALAAVVVLTYVLMLIYRRRQAVNEALERRRLRLLQEQEMEQEAWRRQRLRQVVMLLLQKGLVEEGIPIGFQLPGGHREVHARRDLSRLHRNREDRLRETLTRELDETIDPRIRTILQTPLPVLLQAGRPPEATEGPDILQLLLLDREEFTMRQQLLEEIEEFGGESSSSSDGGGDDDDVDNESENGIGASVSRPVYHRGRHDSREQAEQNLLSTSRTRAGERGIIGADTGDDHSRNPSPLSPSRGANHFVRILEQDAAENPGSANPERRRRVREHFGMGRSPSSADPVDERRRREKRDEDGDEGDDIYSADSSQSDSLTHFLHDITTRPVSEVMTGEFHHRSGLLSRQGSSPIFAANGNGGVGFGRGADGGGALATNRTQASVLVTVMPDSNVTSRQEGDREPLLQGQHSSAFFPDPMQDLPANETKDIKRLLRQQRRKKIVRVPAEELYGPGVPYMINLTNHQLQQRMLKDYHQLAKDSVELDLPSNVQAGPASPIRFLSPIAFPKATPKKSMGSGGGGSAVVALSSGGGGGGSAQNMGTEVSLVMISSSSNHSTPRRNSGAKGVMANPIPTAATTTSPSFPISVTQQNSSSPNHGRKTGGGIGGPPPPSMVISTPNRLPTSTTASPAPPSIQNIHSSASSAPHAFHHEAIHRLLDLGFIIHWVITVPEEGEAVASGIRRKMMGSGVITASGASTAPQSSQRASSFPQPSPNQGGTLSTSETLSTPLLVNNNNPNGNSSSNNNNNNNNNNGSAAAQWQQPSFPLPIASSSNDSVPSSSLTGSSYHHNFVGGTVLRAKECPLCLRALANTTNNTTNSNRVSVGKRGGRRNHRSKSGKKLKSGKATRRHAAHSSHHRNHLSNHGGEDHPHRSPGSPSHHNGGEIEEEGVLSGPGSGEDDEEEELLSSRGGAGGSWLSATTSSLSAATAPQPSPPQSHPPPPPPSRSRRRETKMASSSGGGGGPEGDAGAGRVVDATRTYQQSFRVSIKSRAVAHGAKRVSQACLRYATEIGLFSAVESYRMIAVLPEVVLPSASSASASSPVAGTAAPLPTNPSSNLVASPGHANANTNAGTMASFSSETNGGAGGAGAGAGGVRPSSPSPSSSSGGGLVLPAVVPVNHSRRTPTPHRTAPSSSQQGGSQTPSTQNPHTHHHHHGNANNQNGVKRPATACCGSPAAGPPPQNASVPLVFFTYPSWLQVEEVSEKQRERLLACRRYPFGNTNSGSGGGGGGGASAFTGRPPTAPTSPLSSRSVILLFQPKKELRPMMREPPHPPKELGEVCCCDVYLVLHGGAGAAASTVDDHSRDGELPEMSVWGLCDTSSHLHGASGNGTNGGAGRRPIRASSAHPHTPPLQKGHTEHESTSAVHDGVPTTTTSSTGGSPTNRQHRLSSMHSAASTSMADPHLEFFCIASSLDNYFRLGAAFGWVYGWQLCYCSVGPPVSSIPWLRLFNASAYQAAKALMSSYECVESTSCLAATSRIGMMVDDEEDDVDIVCH